MHRRQFLQLAASGLALRTGIARAAQPWDGPLLLVVNAIGGWDTTMLMDPKGTPRVNRHYNATEILSAGTATRYAPTAAHITAGMSNETFFARYASELLIINGIDISVNNHTPCGRYVATGKLDSDRYPSLPALMAASLGPDLPLPYLALGGPAPTGNVVPKTALTSMSALTNLARADEIGSERYHHAAALDRIDAALEQAAPHSLPARAAANRFVVDAQQASKDLGWIEPHVPASLPSGRLEKQMEIALTGFVAGTTVAATVGISQFDSHEDNDADQFLLIPELLAGIDYALQRATALGIRDRLVVVMQSEMGRTPWYNGNNGKDHWSVGSMMMLGPNIAGDRVVGATTVDPTTGEDQSPMSVDPSTLALDASGVRIRPEHIHHALRGHLGLHGTALDQRFDLGVPAGETLVNLLG